MFYRAKYDWYIEVPRQDPNIHLFEERIMTIIKQIVEHTLTKDDFDDIKPLIEAVFQENIYPLLSREFREKIAFIARFSKANPKFKDIFNSRLNNIAKIKGMYEWEPAINQSTPDLMEFYSILDQFHKKMIDRSDEYIWRNLNEIERFLSICQNRDIMKYISDEEQKILIEIERIFDSVKNAVGSVYNDAEKVHSIIVHLLYENKDNRGIQKEDVWEGVQYLTSINKKQFTAIFEELNLNGTIFESPSGWFKYTTRILSNNKMLKIYEQLVKEKSIITEPPLFPI